MDEKTYERTMDASSNQKEEQSSAEQHYIADASSNDDVEEHPAELSVRVMDTSYNGIYVYDDNDSEQALRLDPTLEHQSSNQQEQVAGLKIQCDAGMLEDDAERVSKSSKNYPKQKSLLVFSSRTAVPKQKSPLVFSSRTAVPYLRNSFCPR